MKKAKKGSLFLSIIMMSVIPLLLLGLTVTLFSVSRFNQVMSEEVEREMHNIAESIVMTYDMVYPGNYVLVGDKVLALYKGEVEITGEYSIIDEMKSSTGMEISIFYDDIRMLTTLLDHNGERMIGTGVNASISRDVMDSKTPKFYERLQISDGYYYVYYRPLYNESGNCVGMLAIAQSVSDVQAGIRKAVTPILLLSAISMILVGWVSLSYANSLSTGIVKVREALSKVSAGNLTDSMDYAVSKRHDEIGEIGKSIAAMQKSLRVLVEQDALTELYNRRYSNNRLHQSIQQSRKQGVSYSVALGDIDYFKKVNDTYGHEAGDEVLKAVAKIMRTHMLGKGYVSRWGGEEFLIVYEGMPYAAAIQEMEALLQKIRLETVLFEEHTIQITMTFGMVKGKEDSMQDKLLIDADHLLYQGKEEGRNRLIAKVEEEHEGTESKESTDRVII